MREIFIDDCPYVDISQTELVAFKIKSLHFSRVDHLRIAPGTLKTVDKLVVKQVRQMECTDGFEQLEADTVTFSHVNFPVGAKFHPMSIKSRLDVVASNLTDVSMMIDSVPTDRAVSIQNSVLDRVSLKINAATFAMDGNRFVQLSSSSPGLMDVAYSHSLNLRDNQIGTASNNAATLLPNVSSSDQSSFVFESKTDEALSVDSKRWLEHFTFKFTGITLRSSRDVQASCERQKTTDSYITSCPNVGSYVRSFSSLEHKSATASRLISTTQKPQNERQVQGKSNASVVKQNWKLSLISILFILMLPFTTNWL